MNIIHLDIGKNQVYNRIAYIKSNARDCYVRKMYHLLFHAVTDAMDLMEEQKYQEALSLLERASRDAAEVYMSE